MSITLKEFVEKNIDKRLIIFGEWHQYVGDTAVVVRIVQSFLAQNKRLVFFMEHFPGNGAMRRELDNAIAGKSWHAIHTFLDTALDTQGKGFKTPMNAWEHTEGRKKLEAILRLAQMKDISVVGHDLPYEDQKEYLTNSKYGNSFDEKERAQLKARDRRMHLQYLSKLKHDSSVDTIIAFVGETHARPQLRMTRHYHPCVALVPQKSFAISAKPIVENKVQLDEIEEDFYRFTC